MPQALFAITDGSSEKEFIILLSDDGKISHARRILSGAETERIHVSGRIIRSIAPYNPNWSFHIEPSSIDFFGISIEICDASFEFVESNLDQLGDSALPNLFWCPWQSMIKAELQLS